MASGPSLSQISLTTKDEFEGLQVAEFDANALWEMLPNRPGEDEETEWWRAPVGPEPDPGEDEETEWWRAPVGPELDPGVGSYGLNNDNVHDLNWEMMEEAYTPSIDMGGWFGGPCMEEMFAVGDYSLSENAAVSDEIGYIQLWQHN